MVLHTQEISIRMLFIFFLLFILHNTTFIEKKSHVPTPYYNFEWSFIRNLSIYSTLIVNMAKKKKKLPYSIASGLKSQNSFSSFSASHVILLQTWLLILGQPNPTSDARGNDYSSFPWKTFGKVHSMCKGPILFF